MTSEQNIENVGNVTMTEATHQGEKHDNPDLAPNSEDALIEAVEQGHHDEVRRLLDLGVDPNASNRKASTVVMRASEKGHVAIVRLLLERGAQMEYIRGNSALVSAAWNGNLEVVALLLEHGADVTATDESGNTALFDAARRGHAEVVKLLLAHGASVLDGAHAMGTALSWASQKGHAQIVELLLASLEKESSETLDALAKVEGVHKKGLADRFTAMAEVARTREEQAMPNDATAMRERATERAKRLREEGHDQRHNLQYAESERLYQKAIEVAPWDLLGYYVLGKLYYLQNEREKALRYYTAAAHLHVGLGQTQDYDEDLRRAHQALFSGYPPDLLRQFQALHQHAPLLLLDNSSRHAGHALVDLQDEEIMSPELSASALAYRYTMSSGNFAQIDSDLEQGFYQPVGISYLLDNIQWSKVGKVPPEAVLELYSATTVNSTVTQATTLDFDFAMNVLARKVGLRKPRSSQPIDDLRREVETILRTLTPTEHADLEPFIVQASQTANEILSGTFYASLGSVLLNSVNGSSAFQPLMARRWRDTIGSKQTPFENFWFALSRLAYSHTMRTPLLDTILYVLRRPVLNDLRNALVHRNYTWDADGAGTYLCLLNDDGTTLYDVRTEVCEAFHIILGTCALIVDKVVSDSNKRRGIGL